ncbi:MAG: AMP-binding protein [Phreatobacter sp.]|uniref:phenylacetate--CoA ligase family protein n=1 Tax=Phreatobacter sp. TaxID=1966341 RepID=UPI001A47CF86|nr:AMP-binding protein [Phreatobacter sp.]MBL8571260.1 AMP-binding protein [Phreatobacter sp.]
MFERIARLASDLPDGSEITQRMGRAGLAHDGLTPSNFAAVPTLSKGKLAAVQEVADGFGPVLPFGGLAEVSRIFRSPGGTYDFAGAGPDYWGFAAYVKAAGIGPDDIAIVALAYQGTPGAFMFDEGLQSVGATVIPTGTMGSEAVLSLIQDLRPTVFVGTPSHLIGLIRRHEETGANWQGTMRLRAALLAGERLTDDVRVFLAERGVASWQAYGTAEAGLIGYECDVHSGLHVRSDILVEICDPATGQPRPDGEAGEVVVTIPRKVYPMLRLGTGDVSAFAGGECPCGRVEKRLVGILGRTDELTKVRGMFIHPRDIAVLAAEVRQAKRLWVEVHRDADGDDVRIVVEPMIDPHESGLFESVEQLFRQRCGLRGRVVVVPQGTGKDGALVRDMRSK